MHVKKALNNATKCLGVSCTDMLFTEAWDMA